MEALSSHYDTSFFCRKQETGHNLSFAIMKIIPGIITRFIIIPGIVNQLLFNKPAGNDLSVLNNC